MTIGFRAGCGASLSFSRLQPQSAFPYPKVWGSGGEGVLNDRCRYHTMISVVVITVCWWGLRSQL